MNLNNIKIRLGGGYFYNRIKYLKGYAKHDDMILQAYLEYCKYVYWHGEKNCTYNSYFETEKEFVLFDDLKLPKMEGHAIGTFFSEFPDVLLPYLIERRGKKYHFEEIDPLMVEGPYELNEKVSVEKNDVVIDCGANIGLFSVIAGNKGAEVYAFEPSRFVIDKYLRKTADWNHNIRICNYALSDSGGIARFAESEINIGGGKISDSEGVEVKKITLDEFVMEHGLERVDYIKSDIEGAEREMLRGAKTVLRKYAPKLSICTYHLPDDKEVLEGIVREANPDYHVIHKYKKMYCWV